MTTNPANFRRCPRCHLPHPAGVTLCPITGEHFPAAKSTPAGAHDEPEPPRKGSLVAGRYKVERELGVGGMGWVHVALDQRTGAPVALKVLRRPMSQGNSAARFNREAEHMRAIEHPGVVKVYDHGVEAGVGYLVMELLTGESAEERLSYLGEFDTTEAVRIARSTLRILEVVHATGIVHRDLKPSNLFLDETTGERRVKLMDFGISRLARAEAVRLTAPGVILGTPWYMSPAQIHGRYDHRVDLYAVGVTLYRLLTGELPFHAQDDETFGRLFRQILRTQPTPPLSHRPDIGPKLNAFILRAMEKDADLGFQTAKEMGEALERATD